MAQADDWKVGDRGIAVEKTRYARDSYTFTEVEVVKRGTKYLQLREVGNDRYPSTYRVLRNGDPISHYDGSARLVRSREAWESYLAEEAAWVELRRKVERTWLRPEHMGLGAIRAVLDVLFPKET